MNSTIKEELVKNIMRRSLTDFKYYKKVISSGNVLGSKVTRGNVEENYPGTT